MIETFDYEKYAQQLAENAEKEIPQDIGYDFKKVIAISVYRCCQLLLEALIEDKDTKFLTDEIYPIVEIIKNWLVQKWIELSKNDIDELPEDKIINCMIWTTVTICTSAIWKDCEKAEMIRIINQHIAKANIKIDKIVAKSKNKIFENSINRVKEIFKSIELLFLKK